ncbi:hypothetical protein PPL_07526 [Heterostelium album PN500]|uniref:SAM domain-containing protein n=1 Tax=Heterostelium pallidum (strain ATCC 26659 / Pp 5 / PN500) TaxID=670386 RepID=D3BG75_HETP5|nr:hypothetical protein PPL_07526 [Heterostelium album PN500]EFA79667.1 hypothetical protein PPL_07526 [Heterostelium album PN500]|eukprot:XP_020431788.1 hypothetical protein PPL_07526 [Heterostelium album PN500]
MTSTTNTVLSSLPNDVKDWTAEQVKTWAITQPDGESYANILCAKEVRGKDLNSLTKNDLLNPPFSIGYSAQSLLQAISSLVGAQASPKSSASCRCHQWFNSWRWIWQNCSDNCWIHSLDETLTRSKRSLARLLRHLECMMTRSSLSTQEQQKI